MNNKIIICCSDIYNLMIRNNTYKNHILSKFSATKFICDDDYINFYNYTNSDNISVIEVKRDYYEAIKQVLTDER